MCSRWGDSSASSDHWITFMFQITLFVASPFTLMSKHHFHFRIKIGQASFEKNGNHIEALGFIVTTRHHWYQFLLQHLLLNVSKYLHPPQMHSISTFRSHFSESLGLHSILLLNWHLTFSKPYFSVLPKTPGNASLQWLVMTTAVDYFFFA